MEENLQKLVLRAGKHIDGNTIVKLRGTKAIKLEDMSNTNEEYDNRTSWGELLLSAHDRPMTSVDVTTWSSLVRNAIEVIRPQLEFTIKTFGADKFRETYEVCLNSLFTEEGMIRANSNFVKRLYNDTEENDLIKSTVYLSNKNHKLEILTDENGDKWYACAVYTGEIIWVLEALLDTIYTLYKEIPENINNIPHHTIVITYTFREEQSDDEVDGLVEGIDKEIQKLALAKDLITLQMKVSRLSSALLEIYADISDIQEKYNIPTADEILKSVK